MVSAAHSHTPPHATASAPFDQPLPARALRAWAMTAVTLRTHVLRAQPSNAESERCERTPLGVAHPR